MEVLAFTVINKEIECDIKQVVGDNDYQASFMLDDEWSDKEVICRVVWNNRTSLDIKLEDLSCVIPAYIMKRGEVSIGVYAEGDEQLTTEPWLLSVRKSIREKEFETAMPHKEIWNEINEKIKNVITSNDLDEKVVSSVNDAIEKSGFVKNDELSTEVSTQVNAYLGENEIDKKLETGMFTADITPILEKGGFYFSGTKIIETTYLSYAKSDYMDIGVGKTFKIKLNNNLYKYKVVQFDSNEGTSDCKACSEGSYLNEDTEITVNKRYVRICMRLVAETDMTLADAQVALTVTKESTTPIKSELLAKNENLLYKASAYFDGDSICYGANSGGISYPDIIALRNEMYLTKKAVSGTTIAIRDGYTNSILERVKAMTEDFDYIVLEGGYNDCAAAVSIGEITEDYISNLDESTFCGAMESICKCLCTNYFEKKKLFIVPHRTLADYVNNYYDKAIEVCKKWGIPTIDLREECNLIPLIGEEIQTQYFEGAGTGVHPTEKGYRVFYVPKIEGRMKTL